MNKPKWLSKNSVCFAFCPVAKPKSTTKPHSQGRTRACISTLTVEDCAVQPQRVTGQKVNTKRWTTAKHNHAPEQKKKPKSLCGDVGEFTKKPLCVCGKGGGLVPPCRTHGFVIANTQGSVDLRGRLDRVPYLIMGTLKQKNEVKRG